MLRGKHSSGKESVLGGEGLGKVAREGLPAVMREKQLGDGRTPAVWVWAERSRQRTARWALAWGVQRTTEMSSAGPRAQMAEGLVVTASTWAFALSVMGAFEGRGAEE